MSKSTSKFSLISFNSSIISSKPSPTISFYYMSKSNFIKLSKLSTHNIISLKPSFLIKLFYKFKLNSLKSIIFSKYIILQYLISTSYKFIFTKSIIPSPSSLNFSKNELIITYLSIFQTYVNHIYTFTSFNLINILSIIISHIFKHIIL